MPASSEGCGLDQRGIRYRYLNVMAGEVNSKILTHDAS